MKKRAPVNPSTDRAVFTRTASKTKAVNLPNVNFRGGRRF